MLVLGVESDIGGLFATIALLEWSCKAEIYNKVILDTEMLFACNRDVSQFLVNENKN